MNVKRILRRQIDRLFLLLGYVPKDPVLTEKYANIEQRLNDIKILRYQHRIDPYEYSMRRAIFDARTVKSLEQIKKEYIDEIAAKELGRNLLQFAAQATVGYTYPENCVEFKYKIGVLPLNYTEVKNDILDNSRNKTQQDNRG